jgi:hypothetical protein
MSSADSPPETSAKQGPAFALSNRYKNNRYWGRGPKSKIGEAAAAFIHIGVGHALTNWEHVELAVSILFSHFSDSATIAPLRAYGTILSTHSRYAAVSQAMDVFFDIRLQMSKRDRRQFEQIKKTKDVTIILLNNYLAASGRRNDIAHGVAWYLNRHDDDKKAWFLAPPSYNAARNNHWIEDDFKFRAATGGSLWDKKSRFSYNRLYYKHADYVFATKELKMFAGKFAYLFADIMSVLHVINPHRFPRSQKELHATASALSQ